MPESFFSTYLAKTCAAISYPEMYRKDEDGKDGFVQFYGHEIRLARAGTVAQLEHAFIEQKLRNTSIIDCIRKSSIESAVKKLEAQTSHFHSSFQVLADFIVNSRLPETQPEIAEKVLPMHDLFILNGNVYPLFEPGANAKIGNKRYNLGLTPIATIPELEKSYQDALKKNNAGKPCLYARKITLEALAAGEYYDAERKIGFRIINNEFYAITKVAPYILYEKRNGSYYAFPEAVAGSRIFFNKNRIDFGKLHVLNAYTHPSLSSANKAMQAICTGNYDYDAIRRRHPGNYVAQIAELMEKARTVFTEEYRSRGKPYAYLSDKRFDAQKITGRVDMQLLTNRN
ncbi:MAG: hypothetical protein KJ955_07085 [Nanoarchaeota archaeon]|nr:hypothetical protein [Nanoarchaeota archaeon]